MTSFLGILSLLSLGAVLITGIVLITRSYYVWGSLTLLFFAVPLLLGVAGGVVGSRIIFMDVAMIVMYVVGAAGAIVLIRAGGKSRWLGVVTLILIGSALLSIGYSFADYKNIRTFPSRAPLWLHSWRSVKADLANLSPSSYVQQSESEECRWAIVDKNGSRIKPETPLSGYGPLPSSCMWPPHEIAPLFSPVGSAEEAAALFKAYQGREPDQVAQMSGGWYVSVRERGGCSTVLAKPIYLITQDGNISKEYKGISHYNEGCVY